MRGKIYSDIKKITLVLEDYTNSISENKSVEPKGTVELQYLGKAVNDYIEMQNIKQNELRYKAETDPLTQVANRRTLEEFMDKKLQQKGSRCAFLFFDVDEFKSINDSYGHDVGDEELKKLVEEVKNKFRISILWVVSAEMNLLCGLKIHQKKIQIL